MDAGGVDADQARWPGTRRCRRGRRRWGCWGRRPAQVEVAQGERCCPALVPLPVIGQSAVGAGRWWAGRSRRRSARDRGPGSRSGRSPWSGRGRGPEVATPSTRSLAGRCCSDDGGVEPALVDQVGQRRCPSGPAWPGRSGPVAGEQPPGWVLGVARSIGTTGHGDRLGLRRVDVLDQRVAGGAGHQVEVLRAVGAEVHAVAAEGGVDEVEVAASWRFWLLLRSRVTSVASPARIWVQVWPLSSDFQMPPLVAARRRRRIRLPLASMSESAA